jgi:capsid protein
MKPFARLRAAFDAFRAPQNNVTTDTQTPQLTPWGTNSTGRGTDPRMPVRALQDMKPVERQTSITRSRFIANRLGLGRAMIEGSTRYAINEGIIGYASTGDKEFDDSCNRVVDDIFEGHDEKSCDIAGALNHYEQQEVICPAMMTDGDCGVAKILVRDTNGRVPQTARPQFQLFATEQIGDESMYAFAAQSPTGPQWREGVQRDEFGRVLKYRILSETAPGYPHSPLGWRQTTFTEFQASDFMLVLDPKRIGMSRGIPWTHHAQNSAITMMDLKTLEESAAYLNAFFGAVITTPNGEIPEGFESEVFRRRNTRTTDNASTGTTDKEVFRKYANFMGGAMIPVLKEGEKLEMVKSERPSVTFTGFMDWLVNDIAWGFGVPPSYVWAIAGRSGPETRLTLQQAQWFFKFIMRRMIARFCKPSRDFVIKWGLLTGRINNGRPPRNGASPFLCRWRGPRNITIDERYFFKTWLDRLDKGLGTEEEFYAELGLEAADIRRTRVDEVADWLQLCKDRGVPYELVREGTPGSSNSGMNAQDLADQMAMASDN